MSAVFHHREKCFQTSAEESVTGPEARFLQKISEFGKRLQVKIKHVTVMSFYMLQSWSLKDF